MKAGEKVTYASLGLCLLVFIAVVLVKSFVRHDPDRSRLDTTFVQLRNVQARIEQVVLDRTRTGGATNMNSVLEGVIQKEGSNYFNSEILPTARLLINPDVEKWTDSRLYANQIAIVSPVSFIREDTGKAYFMGIDFGGQKVLTAELPKW